MRKILFAVVAAVAVVFSSCEKTEDLQIMDPNTDPVGFTEEIIPGQYIVYFENQGLKSAYKTKVLADRAVLSRAESIFENAQVELPAPQLVFSAAVEGVVVNVSENEISKIVNAPGIEGVWPDKMVTLKKPGTLPSDPPAESIPYGIERVGGGVSYTGGHKAWIIDTGIDLDHDDLNVDAASGITYVPRTSSPDDDNGHGTHCAGIVGAIDNEVGVIGVAAGATVVPVKVLDRRGSGAYSTIIAGVDYVKANASAGDAANMSLGGGVYEPVDIAVASLGASGVFVSLAAGNESDDADNHSPARAEGTNLYTISAMDDNDYWAYFSNFGEHVDYCAPGVSILSTYKGGAYATMSGTSMAAPHVCGLLLATNGNIYTDGYVNGDPDGDADPIAHK
ncbi:S8 family serine peptidase [Maribellus comscasis]|uniref:S8 family serine peptidase n=1 Tax=Maribellus comscasis TaxID=2681766 RepID=A0A6I6JV92_9BACT|nr:S8 family peptidase [Maribellus comscasis]QGY47065.1 S8 family serine peptidase [Maribellus comscasis]